MGWPLRIVFCVYRRVLRDKMYCYVTEGFLLAWPSSLSPGLVKICGSLVGGRGVDRISARVVVGWGESTL